MVNKSKIKGTAWETAVVRFLRRRGYPEAERRTLSGQHDRGDIAGVRNVVIECKDAKQQQWAKWMDETEIERANDNATLGVLIAKRPRHPVEDAYCIIPLRVLPMLLDGLEHTVPMRHVEADV